MPLKLSRRAEVMPASPIRRFAPLAVEARQKGRNIFALNIGQPDIPTPKVILDRLKSYSDTYIPYGPSQGLPEYIEALLGCWKCGAVPVNINWPGTGRRCQNSQRSIRAGTSTTTASIKHHRADRSGGNAADGR